MLRNVVLILLSSLLLYQCSSGESPSNNIADAPAEQSSTPPSTEEAPKEQTRGRIVFFGNSLTAGYGLDEQYSFPSLIQQKLDSLELDYQSVNAGISGETTALGLARIDWVLEQPVAVFVLELGGNDVLRGLDLAATRTNLQAILDRVKSKYPNAQLVVAGMEAPPNMGEAYRNTFRTIFRELATANEAALIPFLLDGVGGIPELNLADRVHPNQEGQVIVAQNVWEVISPLLQQES